MKRILLLLLIPAIGFSFEYHYLNQKEEIKNTTSMLLKAGISKKNIRFWLKKTQTHNQDYLPQASSKQQGWLTCEDPADFKYLNSSLGTEYINCRLGLFLLIRDQLSIEQFKRNYKLAAHLKKELSQAEKYYKPALSEKEILLYKSLFQPCKILQWDGEQDIFQYSLDQYNKGWAKEGLKFPADKNIKILQMVIIQEKYKSTFADHVALMIKQDDYLYLLEKISPGEPFMLSRFKTSDELGDYLSQKFIKWKGNSLMLLANDEIIWKIQIPY